ncbi:MAG: MotA/TolQ/ExbB proton channel family protein [Planctomycetia bacterium]|nr:MotA/TolQ/ExbB proton channel family protein [Planctomycetia bacterium]
MNLKSKIKSLAASPILWGGVCFVAFYALIFTNVIYSETFRRYFTHDIEYVETYLFFVGLCALLFKWRDVHFQSVWVGRQEASPDTFFADPKVGENELKDLPAMINRLNQIPAKVREGYFIQRLLSALNFVKRNQSAVGFEDEMKYLADLDAGRMAQGYSFVRVVIWAIPILGFLGTVMGITQAIGGLGGNLSDTDSTLPKMISSLSLAFDTTALALSFSIILMFLQYYIEKLESHLLDRVDFQTHRELSGRFESRDNTPEGIVSAVRAQCDAFLAMLAQNTKTQTALWEDSFKKVEMEWTQRLNEVGNQCGAAIRAAFEGAAREFIQKTTPEIALATGREVEARLSENVLPIWANYVAELRKLQEKTEENAQNFGSVAQAFVSAGGEISQTNEVLNAAVESIRNAAAQMSHLATGAEQVVRMENILAQNLSTLQGARNFEHTVLQLSQAASELTAWLESVKKAKG